MAKKEDLLKGLTPLSAAKKVYKKLSAQTGKSSVKFELQETTKDSKKKVYGPYKGSFVKDKIKVKMAGGGNGNTNDANYNSSNGSNSSNSSNNNEYYLMRNLRKKLKNADDDHPKKRKYSQQIIP